MLFSVFEQWPAEHPTDPSLQPPSKPFKQQITDVDRQKEEEELQMALALSIKDRASQSSTQKPAQDSSTTSAGASAAPAPTSPLPSGTTAATVSRVRALYDFQPSEPGELQFRKGDVIAVLESVYKDWWKGLLRGQTGIFPLNYVEKLQDPTAEELQREAEMEGEVFGQIKNVERLLALLSTSSPDTKSRDNEEITVSGIGAYVWQVLIASDTVSIDCGDTAETRRTHCEILAEERFVCIPTAEHSQLAKPSQTTSPSSTRNSSKPVATTKHYSSRPYRSLLSPFTAARRQRHIATEQVEVAAAAGAVVATKHTRLHSRTINATTRPHSPPKSSTRHPATDLRRSTSSRQASIPSVTPARRARSPCRPAHTASSSSSSRGSQSRATTSHKSCPRPTSSPPINNRRRNSSSSSNTARKPRHSHNSHRPSNTTTNPTTRTTTAKTSTPTPPSSSSSSNHTPRNATPSKHPTRSPPARQATRPCRRSIPAARRTHHKARTRSSSSSSITRTSSTPCPITGTLPLEEACELVEAARRGMRAIFTAKRLAGREGKQWVGERRSQ